MLGLYVVRGDNMCAPASQAAGKRARADLCAFCSRSLSSRSAVVGELDEDLDANLDLSAIVAAPLKAVFH